MLRDDLGLSIDNLIVWNKLWLGPGARDYRPQHEFVLYHRGEQWHGGREQVDIKELRRDDSRGLPPPHAEARRADSGPPGEQQRTR